MRVDPDTSIHDLTDTEAADLRALCESMIDGRVTLVQPHPLFRAWADVVDPERHDGEASAAAAFLPRALFALLRRADDRGVTEAQAALYAADRAKTAAQKRYDKAVSEWRKTLVAQVKG